MRLFKRRKDEQPGSFGPAPPTATEKNAIDLLLQSPYSVATCARFHEGPSADVLTVFMVHEDRPHVDGLPEQVPIDIRASLFVRQGVGVVTVMLGIGDDTYETWWNFHNPALRKCFDDICEQDKLLVSFFVDRPIPERIVWIPNTLRARFREVVGALEEMETWEMTAFDRAREEVYAEYPTPQALWASMEDVSTGSGLASLSRATPGAGQEEE